MMPAYTLFEHSAIACGFCVPLNFGSSKVESIPRNTFVFAEMCSKLLGSLEGGSRAAGTFYLY